MITFIASTEIIQSVYIYGKHRTLPCVKLIVNSILKIRLVRTRTTKCDRQLATHIYFMNVYFLTIIRRKHIYINRVINVEIFIYLVFLYIHFCHSQSLPIFNILQKIPFAMHCFPVTFNRCIGK